VFHTASLVSSIECRHYLQSQVRVTEALPLRSIDCLPCGLHYAQHPVSIMSHVKQSKIRSSAIAEGPLDEISSTELTEAQL